MRSFLLVVAILMGLESRGHAFDNSGLAGELTATTGSVSQIDLARSHFEEGIRLYTERKWALARFEFEASYSLSKSPDLLHNLSMVAEQQGQLSDAIVWEERFIVDKGRSLSAIDRESAVSRLSRLRQLNKPPKPAIPVPVVADSPDPQPLSGTGTTVEQPTPKPKRTRWPFALIGLGAASLIVTIGTGAAVIDIKTTIEQGGTYSPSDYDALYGRGQTLNGVSIAFGAVGGLLVAGGAVWLIADRVRRR